jgi:hypothetical protein
MDNNISAVSAELKTDIIAVEDKIRLRSLVAAVEARTRCADGGNTGTNIDKVKPPKFDGSKSRTVFHSQVEAAPIRNVWTPREKAADFLSVPQGQASDILHSVPAETSYEDIVRAMQNRFVDHQLAAACRSQLKARVQMSGETLQEFAAAVEQLAHQALVGLTVGFIQTGVADVFIDGVRDLLMGGDRTVNEALNQDLNLERPKR